MTESSHGLSPQVYARLGGVIYLILIVAGFFASILVRGKLIVPGDAVATAGNIIASQGLWRLGVVAEIIMHICDVPLMLVFFLLLRPVNKMLAMLAVLFNLVQTAVLVMNKLNLFAALFPLGSADYLRAIEEHQLQAQVYLSLKLHDYGFALGLVFFGFVCMINGYLILKSGYLPRTLGVLLQVAGVCYLTNSFTLFLAPAFAGGIFPAILIPCFVAELSLGLWLTVKGVHVQKWHERLRVA